MTVVYQGTRDVPVADLKGYPGNPRRGNIHAIATSLHAHGQYRAVVARDTGDTLVILAGNHTCEALQLLYDGWLPPDTDPSTTWAGRPEVARCDVVTCTTEEARKIVAADNRTADLGTYDDDLLAELLTQIADDGAGFGGTGWTDEDVSGILGSFDLDAAGEDDEPASEHDPSDEDDEDTPASGDVTRGELLALAGVTIGEPRHQVTRGQIWRLGPHWLVIADLFTDWPVWSPLLTGDVVFLPYPTPLTPHAPYAAPLVMVQPETYLAGHLLDKWQDITGEKPAETPAA